MGFFSRIGSKLADAYSTGSRLGHKVLGGAARLGNKIADVGSQVVKGVKGIPIVSTALATPIAMAERGIDIVKTGAGLAAKGDKLLGQVDNVVREGRDSLNRLEKNNARRQGDLQRQG